MELRWREMLPHLFSDGYSLQMKTTGVFFIGLVLFPSFRLIQLSETGWSHSSVPQRGEWGQGNRNRVETYPCNLEFLFWPNPEVPRASEPQALLILNQGYEDIVSVCKDKRKYSKSINFRGVRHQEFCVLLNITASFPLRSALVCLSTGLSCISKVYQQQHCILISLRKPWADPSNIHSKCFETKGLLLQFFLFSK